VIAAATGWMVLGFTGQAMFGLRLILQWIASERAGRPVVPPIYWRMGLAGGLCVLGYAIAVGNAIFSLSVIPGIFISGRNLRIRHVRTKHTLIAWMIPFVLVATLAIVFQRKVGAPAWATVGYVGSALWATRAFVQWWVSERTGKSTLPRAFWLLSLAGSVLLLAYALSQKDPVMTIGYVMGCVPYVRNLVLLARHSSNSKLETTSMTLDPTRPSSVTDQSGASSD
jgi:lipid-A-disaccharide synthase-like uncharacterized protein